MSSNKYDENKKLEEIKLDEVSAGKCLHLITRKELVNEAYDLLKQGKIKQETYDRYVDSLFNVKPEIRQFKFKFPVVKPINKED